MKQKKETQIVPIEKGTSIIPDLKEAKVSVMDYGSDYYTPTEKGEKIRAVYLGLSERSVQSFSGNDEVTIPCVNLLIQDGSGFRTIYNGSKRLVGAIEQNNLEIGTMLEIEYQGKRKNKTNAYTSDRWSIRPLIIKI